MIRHHLPLATSFTAGAPLALAVSRRHTSSRPAVRPGWLGSAAVWRNALSAALLLGLAALVGAAARSPLSAADLLTERMCLVAGLGFLVRLAFLVRAKEAAARAVSPRLAA
ncbi:MAG: hypothetical protein KGI67_15860 [Pseudomonadota bacterium]|nr:hypothetical protein [Pseudomonadota bacterium]